MIPFMLIIAVLWMPDPPVTAEDHWHVEQIQPLTTEGTDCDE